MPALLCDGSTNTETRTEMDISNTNEKMLNKVKKTNAGKIPGIRLCSEMAGSPLLREPVVKSRGMSMTRKCVAPASHAKSGTIGNWRRNSRNKRASLRKDSTETSGLRTEATSRWHSTDGKNKSTP